MVSWRACYLTWINVTEGTQQTFLNVDLSLLLSPTLKHSNDLPPVFLLLFLIRRWGQTITSWTGMPVEENIAALSFGKLISGVPNMSHTRTMEWFPHRYTNLRHFTAPPRSFFNLVCFGRYPHKNHVYNINEAYQGNGDTVLEPNPLNSFLPDFSVQNLGFVDVRLTILVKLQQMTSPKQTKLQV